MVILLTLIVIVSNCPYGQYYQFVHKTNIYPYPIIQDPYKKTTPEYL